MPTFTPAFLRCLRLFLCGLSLAALPVVQAQPAAAPTAAKSYSDEPLVIANGQFTRDGQTLPATVKNLMEVVRQRYRDTNITVVGVDEVKIERLTLNWARYHSERDADDIARRVNPPLQSVLTALAAAAEHKFVATMFSPNDALLEPPAGPEGKSGPVTEVFNLSPYLTQSSRQAANIEEQLRNAEIELKVMRQRYLDKHPNVIQLTERVDLLKAQLASVGQSRGQLMQAAEDLVDQIRQVVSVTLQSQRSAEKVPEFQFHPGTNLLVATGTENAINLTRKVIAALDKGH